jgi:uncharacterized protein (TIGR02246 family)
MSLRLLLLLSCLAGAPAFAEAEEPAAELPTPQPSVRGAVEAGNYFFRKAFEARDAQAIAELYTEDARVVAPGMEPAIGRAAIAEFWRGAMQGTKSVQLQTLAVESAGDLAVEDGVVRLTATDGSESSARYLVVWKRVGRRWHLHRDIWNAGEAALAPTPEAAPPPEAPPAPAPAEGGAP